MNDPMQWTTVDGYITELLARPGTALRAALEASDAAGLPAIAVSPAQGKLLQVLAQAQGARAVLEIGTLAGYSTLWLAQALRHGGRVVTLELDPHHAEIATRNIAAAGYADVVEVRVGPARETLAQMVAEEEGPFDLVFVDADKVNAPIYFEEALKLSRVGTLIVVDNVVRNGALIEDRSEDPSVQGVRRLHEMVAAEPRVSATTIQTVGSKGYDGFLLAVVVHP